MTKQPAITLSICGSAAGEQSEEVMIRVRILGAAMVARNIGMLTGAGQGYPYEAALAYAQKGGNPIGISPALNFVDHQDNFHYPTAGFSSIIYTGMQISGRNVVLVRSGDAIICIGGGAGTMHEFTTAFDEGKPIGVLADSGGVSAEFLPLAKKFYRKPRHSGILIAEHNPEKLLDLLLTQIQRS